MLYREEVSNVFYIVYVDDSTNGRYQAIVDKSGRPNRYGQKLLFKKPVDAQKWIARRSYPHMTHHYIIMEEES